jgi:formate dehydrogenase
MKLAMTEVYEVATFYHHFDVIKEGDAVPPAITVRVCDSLSCALGGANDLLSRLPAVLGPGVRVIPAPCVGRCHGAPVAVVGQNPLDHADIAAVEAAVKSKAVKAPAPQHIDLAHYRAGGGYRTLQECLGGKRDLESVLKTMEIRACAAWAVRAFPQGANGASCAPSRRRG